MTPTRTTPIAATLALLLLLGAAPLAAQAAPTLPEDTLNAYRGTPTPSSEALIPPEQPRRAAATLPQDSIAAYESGGFRMTDDGPAPARRAATDTGEGAAAPARNYRVRVRIDTLRVVNGVAEVTVRYDTLWTGRGRQRR